MCSFWSVALCNALIEQKNNMYYLALTRAEGLKSLCLCLRRCEDLSNVQSCSWFARARGLVWAFTKTTVPPNKRSFVWGRSLDGFVYSQ